jgi:hypothetical protein
VLAAKEAGRAAKLGRKLQPYVQEDPDARQALERLIKRWDQRARPGAPVVTETLFARLMQAWACRALGGELRAYELVAAAVACGLAKPVEGKQAMLERWRRRAHAQPFASEVNERRHASGLRSQQEWKEWLDRLRASEIARPTDDDDVLPAAVARIVGEPEHASPTGDDDASRRAAVARLHVKQDLEHLLRYSGSEARSGSASVPPE